MQPYLFHFFLYKSMAPSWTSWLDILSPIHLFKASLYLFRPYKEMTLPLKSIWKVTESSVFNSSVGGFVITMMKLEAIQLLHIWKELEANPEFTRRCVKNYYRPVSGDQNGWGINYYRPVTQGHLALGSSNLLPKEGSPGGRPKIATSQLLDVPQQSITTIGLQLMD